MSLRPSSDAQAPARIDDEVRIEVTRGGSQLERLAVAPFCIENLGALNKADPALNRLFAIDRAQEVAVQVAVGRAPHTPREIAGLEMRDDLRKLLPVDRHGILHAQGALQLYPVLEASEGLRVAGQPQIPDTAKGDQPLTLERFYPVEAVRAQLDVDAIQVLASEDPRGSSRGARYGNPLLQNRHVSAAELNQIPSGAQASRQPRRQRCAPLVPCRGASYAMEP